MQNEKTIDIAALVLRVVFGSLMIINHGWGKFMRFFGDEPLSFADPIGVGQVPSLVLATFAEVLCAALVIIGFKVRLSVIPLIITMLVAIFAVHINDPFKRMETAILFLTVFSAIGLMGAGRYSIDGMLENKS